MKVSIFNAYTEKTETFSGDPEQVRQQLLARYDYLANKKHATLDEDLSYLARQQALFVDVEK